MMRKSDIIYLCDESKKMCESLFGQFDKNNVVILCEYGFNYKDIIAYIIKPFLRYCFAREGFAFIHASSFSMNGKVVLIAAWAHTGKTNSLLTAIAKGASFYGDDLSC